MAGLYFHIPFCRQACAYCNFHFSTSFRKKDELIGAMQTELELRREALAGQVLHTIYFGGGTPSALDPSDIDALLMTAHSLYAIAPDAEVTLEANPEDITPERLAAWKASGINRLSLGIQGFHDEMLARWNRIHDAAGGHAAIRLALEAGFQNISVDLIYGDPILDDASWLSAVDVITGLGIPHISCYALTVENRTPLEYQIRKGRRPPVDEDQAARQYALLQARLDAAGYIQYEVSNFALPGWRSRHNTSYWEDIPYLGIGPSAHSYDGRSRQWNIAHNIRYIDGIQAGAPVVERELLTPIERYNEWVMTGLRTSMGVSRERIASLGESFLTAWERGIRRYVESGQVWLTPEGRWVLNPESYFLADGIASDLFLLPEKA